MIAETATIQILLILNLLQPAYDMYMKFFDGDKQKIRNLLLTFVNGIQAIYHYPKLRTFVDFTIVYIELMETQAFNTGGSERTQLLTNFCDYQVLRSSQAMEEIMFNTWLICLCD